MERRGWGAVHIDFSQEDGRQWARGRGRAAIGAEQERGLKLDSSHYPAFENRRSLNRREEPESGLVTAFRLVAQTSLPSLTLVTLILLTFSLTHQGFSELARLASALGVEAPSTAWVNWSGLGIALGFFAIQLTSRRHGMEIALAQIVSAWVLAGSILLAWPELALGEGGLMTVRAALSLAAALLISHLVVAVVFDGARCIRWWQAPLMSGLWASFVFAFLFYPFALMGTGQQWFGLLLVQLGALMAAVLLLLFPYWIVRPMIRPRAGYSGY